MLKKKKKSCNFVVLFVLISRSFIIWIKLWLQVTQCSQIDWQKKNQSNRNPPAQSPPEKSLWFTPYPAAMTSAPSGWRGCAPRFSFLSPRSSLSLTGQGCKSCFWFCLILVFAAECSDLQRCWQIKVTVPTANHAATVLLPALQRAGEMPGKVEVITAGRL